MTTVETFKRNLKDKNFVSVPWSDEDIEVAVKVFRDVLA